MSKLTPIEAEISNDLTTESRSFTEIQEMLLEDPVDVLLKCDFSDEQLLRYLDFIPVEVMLEQNISDTLLHELLLVNYLSPDDIKDLSMKTYSNLSDLTIGKYKDYINFEKLGLYLIADNNFDVNKYESFLSDERSHEFWEAFSTMHLSIDDLDKYQKNINWDLFFTTNLLSDAIMNKFPEIVESHHKLPTVTTALEKLQKYQDGVNQRIETDVDEIEQLINNIK